MVPPELFFLPVAALTIQACLSFQTNFRTVFSCSVKNSIGTLVGFANSGVIMNLITTIVVSLSLIIGISANVNEIKEGGHDYS